MDSAHYSITSLPFHPPPLTTPYETGTSSSPLLIVNQEDGEELADEVDVEANLESQPDELNQFYQTQEIKMSFKDNDLITNDEPDYSQSSKRKFQLKDYLSKSRSKSRSKSKD